MTKDKFSTMVDDGNTIMDILESVPENKRPLLSMMAEAFISGMIAQGRVTDQLEQANAI